LGGPVLKEKDPAREAGFSGAVTAPVLSVRFFVFISSVTFLKPAKKKNTFDDAHLLKKSLFLQLID
jgi:hypothetical protein